jgi:hypothetical protein
MEKGNELTSLKGIINIKEVIVAAWKAPQFSRNLTNLMMAKKIRTFGSVTNLYKILNFRSQYCCIVDGGQLQINSIYLKKLTLPLSRLEFRGVIRNLVSNLCL